MRKRILFVHRHGPYGSTAGREALDAVLVTAAFDQDVSLLFVEDGVLLLLKGQSDAVIAVKDASPAYQSLPLYEVERLCVDGQALAERGLSFEDLLVPVEVLDRAGVRALIEAQDSVLGF